jgi:hypothetical protein
MPEGSFPPAWRTTPAFEGQTCTPPTGGGRLAFLLRLATPPLLAFCVEPAVALAAGTLFAAVGLFAAGVLAAVVGCFAVAVALFADVALGLLFAAAELVAAVGLVAAVALFALFVAVEPFEAVAALFAMVVLFANVLFDVS